MGCSIYGVVLARRAEHVLQKICDNGRADVDLEAEDRREDVIGLPIKILAGDADHVVRQSGAVRRAERGGETLAVGLREVREHEPHEELLDSFGFFRVVKHVVRAGFLKGALDVAVELGDGPVDGDPR